MISSFTSNKFAPDSAIADSPYDLTSSENVSFFRLILKLIRMKQWIKNGFVFVPLLFLFAMPSVRQVLSCALGAFFFCLVSSAVYIMNDIVDVSKDRAHPVKRNRPIASHSNGKRYREWTSAPSSFQRSRKWSRFPRPSAACPHRRFQDLPGAAPYWTCRRGSSSRRGQIAGSGTPRRGSPRLAGALSVPFRRPRPASPACRRAGAPV